MFQHVLYCSGYIVDSSQQWTNGPVPSVSAKQRFDCKDICFLCQTLFTQFGAVMMEVFDIFLFSICIVEECKNELTECNPGEKYASIDNCATTYIKDRCKKLCGACSKQYTFVFRIIHTVSASTPSFNWKSTHFF